MSNQSATVNAISNCEMLEENFPFTERCKVICDRAVGRSGLTIERMMLNRNKVDSALRADYKAHFPSIYGKTDRLPEAINAKILAECDKYIESQLQLVNKHNALSVRKAFHHDFNNQRVTERVVATGENMMTLEQQRLGCKLFIGENNRKLKDLEAKPTPDYDREKQVREALMKLHVTLAHIESEIAKQAELAKP